MFVTIQVRSAEGSIFLHRQKARLVISEVSKQLYNALGDAMTATISLSGFIYGSFGQKIHDPGCDQLLMDLGVRNRPCVNVSQFYNFSQEMVLRFPHIGSLQLQPQAVVTWAWPTTGAIGHDLLNDPKRRKDVLNTVAKEDIVIAGPFNLVQGGFGLIVRFPVWVSGDRNWDTWWGLVAALIFVDKLLDDTAHLDDMVLDYYYDLSFYNPNTMTIDLIRKKVPDAMNLRDKTDDPLGPICQNVTIRNDALNWEFCLIPKQGWSGEMKVIDWIVPVALGLAAALLCLLLGAGIIISSWYYKKSTENARVPRGRIAMVFTDIQDSTALWETDAAHMRLMLAEHDTFMRALIHKYNGYEVKTEGDAFFVAFSDPDNAILWALEVQSGLLALDWPMESDMMCIPSCEPVSKPGSTQLLWQGYRVRCGIHYGTPDVIFRTDIMRGDYYGPTVNVAARVAGYGYGGQIIVSDTVLGSSKILKGHREDIYWKDLGLVSLKGILEPQRLHLILPQHLSGRSWDETAKREVTLHITHDNTPRRPRARGNGSIRSRTPTVSQRPSMISNASDLQNSIQVLVDSSNQSFSVQPLQPTGRQPTPVKQFLSR